MRFHWTFNKRSYSRYLFLNVFFFLFTLSVKAQSEGINEEKYRLAIQKATGKITLDGVLDELDWQTAETAGNFWQRFPYDSSKASTKTEVKVTFDNHFLYIAAICHQPPKYIIQSLRRDYAISSSDCFITSIDPFRDKLNGFCFAVSPLGAQSEGLISNGNSLSNDWDNKWYSHVKNYGTYWIAELAIPFKTLRYKQKKGLNEWNINFGYNNLVSNDRSVWARVPRNFNSYNLTFSGTLVWLTPPPKPGANISLIPYVTTRVDQNNFDKQPAKPAANAGFDAKVAVTPSLNLDLTVNPDFSQVEVDQQVTNLSRFNLSYPEKRQFFLENSDLFASFGASKYMPFYSRKIGIYKDQRTQNRYKIPIIGGARLSGRINKNYRIGAMSMQTAGVDSLNAPAANYSVFAIQRKVFARSNLAFIFVNKENFLQKDTASTLPNRFDRLAGLEFNLNSRDGKWQGKVLYHQEFTPQNLPGQNVGAVFITHSSTRWNISDGLEYVGQNYNPAVGYVPRNNYYRTEPKFYYVIYPKSSIVNKLQIALTDADIYMRTTDYKLLDWDVTLGGFKVKFQNSSKLRVVPYRWDYTYLYQGNFDPTNLSPPTDSLHTLKQNTGYLYPSSRIYFTSNARKKFSYVVKTKFGKYYDGSIVAINSSWSYRIQPFGIISLNANYTRIRQPRPFNSAALWVLGPKFDISFTKSIFLTTYLQYNNQDNNVNLYVRFQWRFRPVSDLYIVYTDNYFATATTMANDYNIITSYQPFQSKNRAIVLKLTYWLNL